MESAAAIAAAAPRIIALALASRIADTPSIVWSCPGTQLTGKCCHRSVKDG
jgi:hypothetical protein